MQAETKQTILSNGEIMIVLWLIKIVAPLKTCLLLVLMNKKMKKKNSKTSIYLVIYDLKY